MSEQEGVPAEHSMTAGNDDAVDDAVVVDDEGWTNWFLATLLNNGGAKEALRPTLAGTSLPALREIAHGKEIEWELDFVGIVQRGVARCNGAGNFFMRGCRLDISWPGLPDRSHYLVRFRPKPVEADAGVRSDEPSTSDAQQQPGGT